MEFISGGSFTTQQFLQANGKLYEGMGLPAKKHQIFH